MPVWSNSPRLWMAYDQQRKTDAWRWQALLTAAAKSCPEPATEMRKPANLSPVLLGTMAASDSHLKRIVTEGDTLGPSQTWKSVQAWKVAQKVLRSSLICPHSWYSVVCSCVGWRVLCHWGRSLWLFWLGGVMSLGTKLMIFFCVGCAITDCASV